MFYGAETWAVKAEHLRKLNSFHRTCIRSIAGVSKARQWKDHITSENLAQSCGIEGDIAELLQQRRLRWLGHIARTDATRLPKQVLFGELRATRPRQGPEKRFRDVPAADCAFLQVTQDWYQLAQDRKAWWERCHTKPEEDLSPANEFSCRCGRTFRRRSDRTRHEKFCRCQV